VAARPLHSLPGLVLAWTLAFLIAPAPASAACSGAVTTTYTGPAGGDWTSAANWDNGAPAATDVACVPAGKSVTVSSGATVADIEVEGTLRVTGVQLTVGPNIGSRLAGDVQVDTAGVLELQSNTTYDAGTLSLSNGELRNVSGNSLTLDGGVDIAQAGGGFITNAGQLNIAGSTGANKTDIDAVLNNDGVITNSGPVNVNGGGTGNGSWKLGSGTGPDEPIVSINTTTFSMNGDFTDVDSGGLGHLVIHSTVQMVTVGLQDPHMHVFQLDLPDAASTLDFAPAAGGFADVFVAYLNVNNPAGFLEVDALLQAQTVVVNDGVLQAGADWELGQVHWGGGDISAANGSTVSVEGLDMTQAAGDTEIRSLSGNVRLLMNGQAFTGIPTYDGTVGVAKFTVNAGTIFQIAPGVHFEFGADVDILGTGTVANEGIIDKKTGAGAGSRIQPQVATQNGELWVSDSGSSLNLDLAPDTFVAGTLGGTVILDGILSFPGTVTALAGQIQLGASGQITDGIGGPDAVTTLVANVAGSTITVQNPMSLTQNFVNQGTIDVQGSAILSVAAGKTYEQQAGGVTNLSAAGSRLTVPGGVTVTGGTLQGVGSIDADVVNSGGTVSPGNSPGTLTINGNFTQNGTGLYMEEIDGPAPGQFDQLIVLGTATLGGTLVIGSTNGYQAADTQQFQIVNSAGGIVGTWDGVVQTPFFPYFEQIYVPNTMVLIANSVSLGDVTVNEGSSADFTVSLGQASPSTVSVDWATQDGTATAGSDYAAAGGTVTFAPGETAKTVSVPVTSDGDVEPEENFAVNLSNPVNTRIRDANGVGTIGVQASAAQAQLPPGDIDGFATAPPPIQGRAVNVEPAGGTVLVKLPGAARFVPLPDAEQVPVGTIVDARNGTVRLFSAGKGGRVQSALFYQGVFQVTQKVGQALTVLKLVGGSFAGCPAPKRASASAKRRANSSVRHLWGSGAGEFRTAGRYASATIRGTKWLTDDRCNGTLIRVTAGSVTVRDLTLNKTFALKKPKSYLAPAVKPRKRR
jgi:hypothetical protein